MKLSQLKKRLDELDDDIKKFNRILKDTKDLKRYLVREYEDLCNKEET